MLFLGYSYFSPVSCFTNYFQLESAGVFEIRINKNENNKGSYLYCLSGVLKVNSNVL